MCLAQREERPRAPHAVPGVLKTHPVPIVRRRPIPSKQRARRDISEVVRGGLRKTVDQERGSKRKTRTPCEGTDGKRCREGTPPPHQAISALPLTGPVHPSAASYDVATVGRPRGIDRPVGFLGPRAIQVPIGTHCKRPLSKVSYMTTPVKHQNTNYVTSPHNSS